MRKLGKLFSCFLLILLFSPVFAERPTLKFGEVSSTDFAPKFYAIDSNANAIVLGHFGEAYYEGDNKGGFSVIYKKHLRVRLLNKNGFDAATLSIPLLVHSGMEERIEKLEAYTFNLVNGKVEKTKLDNGSIFKDKVQKNFEVRKFTMPNLQEGSIIDIRYTVNSPYERNIDPWTFQGQYPVLWSEYKVSVPQLYDFVLASQGYHPFAERTTSSSYRSFNITEPGTAGTRSEYYKYDATVFTSTFAMENVPALKEEAFTTTLENHISKISFQLSKIRYPNTPVRDVTNTWFNATDQLMKHASFGEELSGNLSWLKDDVKNIVKDATDMAAAKLIYAFVRDNFTCSSARGLYKTNSFKKILSSKTGNVADINLLLVAMLRVQGFEAHPVILSTRDNGFIYDTYPIMERINYVVCRVNVNNKFYLLDASNNKLGFGNLPINCYNGSSRVVDKMPYVIRLSPDSLVETKITSFFLSKNEEDSKLKGGYTSILGKTESHAIRERLAKSSQEDFFKEITKAYPSDYVIKNHAADSLKQYDEPVAIKYDMEVDFDEDIIYLNPLFAEGYKQNLFKAVERRYPVEMPHAMNEMIVATIDIPKGYEVDEMPKSARVFLNENEGMFEYLISKDDYGIHFRCVVKINKATFQPEDYETLREFFGFIVQKQSEQIVFKKIKK